MTDIEVKAEIENEDELIEGEEEEEEEEGDESEEESDDDDVEIKLDLTDKSPGDPTKNFFSKPISLQPSSNDPKSQPKLNQQNIDNVFDVEYENIPHAERAWNKPGADITDYFNYGFNEDTWKAYCNEQKARRMKQKHFSEKISVHESSKTTDLPPELRSVYEDNRIKPSSNKGGNTKSNMNTNQRRNTGDAWTVRNNQNRNNREEDLPPNFQPVEYNPEQFDDYNRTNEEYNPNTYVQDDGRPISPNSAYSPTTYSPTSQSPSNYDNTTTSNTASNRGGSGGGYQNSNRRDGDRRGFNRSDRGSGQYGNTNRDDDGNRSSRNREDFDQRRDDRESKDSRDRESRDRDRDRNRDKDYDRNKSSSSSSSSSSKKDEDRHSSDKRSGSRRDYNRDDATANTNNSTTNTGNTNDDRNSGYKRQRDPKSNDEDRKRRRR